MTTAAATATVGYHVRDRHYMTLKAVRVLDLLARGHRVDYISELLTVPPEYIAAVVAESRWLRSEVGCGVNKVRWIMIKNMRRLRR